MYLLRIFAIIAFVACGAYATTPPKQVLITFPDDVPQSTVTESKNAVTAAGGQILCTCFPGQALYYFTLQAVSQKHADNILPKSSHLCHFQRYFPNT